jgi:serine/threonine protein kinase
MNDTRHTPDKAQKEDGQSVSCQKAKTIVARVLEKRELGEPISDCDLLSANPDIHKELKEELELGARIRQASLWARRIDPPSKPLTPLTDSKVDQPIVEQSFADDLPEGIANVWPRIPGYFILDKISQGGQATVYQARQESTERIVAVKVITGGPFVTSRHKMRFEREAKILAILDHPNVVSIIDRGRTSDGSFFFVMQYVDGVAFDEYWNDCVTPDSEGTRRVVKVFAKIALAVEVAHAHGVIHRDLKPSNVRIDRVGEPHILDFGLARINREENGVVAESITTSGQLFGSMPWISPEQAAGSIAEMGITSDIYSLGVILYQSLTNEFPNSIEGPIDQVLRRIRKDEAPPPSSQKNARAGIDTLLDGIVLRCLEKSPKARYGSAQQLAADLEAWLSGRPVIAHRRRPLHFRILLLIASVSICLCAALIAGFGKQGDRPLQTFELPHITNSLGMRMVRIAPGSFIFGSPDAERGRDPTEGQEVVSIEHPFFICNTDVTQAQYEEIMHSNPSNMRWRGPDFPVQTVTELDAIQFCDRLSSIESRHYRLPTEIEWEYACRANSKGPFVDGADPKQIGWYFENSRGEIQPVAQDPPNAWGLYDMHGEVGQLCSDILSKKMARVVRGGSALLPMDQCRSASRRVVAQIAHKPDIGFRVACDP